MEHKQILLILQGIPASGKTTWARDFIKNNSENWIIVNRDSIRNMFGNYWVPSRENLVTIIEDDIIKEALKKGYGVIVDATNLNGDERFIKLLNEIDNKDIVLTHKFFEIELEEAIKRDIIRKESVGENVIRKFYDKVKRIKK